MKGLSDEKSDPEKPLPLIEIPVSTVEDEAENSEERPDERNKTPMLRWSEKALLQIVGSGGRLVSCNQPLPLHIFV